MVYDSPDEIRKEVIRLLQETSNNFVIVFDNNNLITTNVQIFTKLLADATVFNNESYEMVIRHYLNTQSSESIRELMTFITRIISLSTEKEKEFFEILKITKQTNAN